MLDPISALSVATSAVQFIDFSAKTVSLIRRNLQSKSGDAGQFKALKSSIERLSALNSCLAKTITPQHLNRKLTPVELDIISIGLECDEIASQLTQTLSGITADKAKGKWSVIRRSVKSIWAQKDVELLEHRMSECKQSLTTTILVNIQ
jgi:hypothetical protein